MDIDSTSSWSVTVTEEDRQRAVRCSPTRCVAAWAIRRQRGVVDARVGAEIMRVFRRRGSIRYNLERNTKQAIKAYDNAGELLPVGFVLRFVPPRKPLGSRIGEPSGSSKRSGARTNVATRQPSHRHIDVEPL